METWEKQFRLGSICSPEAAVRQATIDHFVDCVRITRELGSKVIGIWLADGTNYPGQDHLRSRKQRMFEGLKTLYEAMDDDMTNETIEAALRQWGAGQLQTAKRLLVLGVQMEKAFIWDALDFAVADAETTASWWKASVTFPEDFSYEKA